MRLFKLVWLLCLSSSAFAQFNTNMPTRPLALQEALRLALENNLEIQIARMNPEIARYNWQGSYGVWDPVLYGSAIHGINVSEGGGFDEEGDATQGVDTKFDRMGAGLRGFLPTGLSYDLSGNFGHTYGTREIFPFDTYEGLVQATLSQPLLRDFWIDANRLTIRLAKHDLKIAENQFMVRILDVVNRTQQAFYELIATRDLIAARQKALDLAERFAEETKRRVELGTLPPLDHVSAQSEAAASRADLISARQLSVLAENALKTLITHNYELWHSYAIEPTERLVAVPEDLDLGASWLSGITLRPDYNLLKEQLERQGVVVKYQHNQLFPYVNLTGTYGRAGIDNKFRTIVFTNTVPLPGPDQRDIVVIPGRDANFTDVLDDIRRDNNPRYSFGVVVEMPIPFRRERGQYNAAKSVREQLKLQLEQLHNLILTDIDNTVSAVRANFERVAATRQARIFSEAALDAETKRMDAGRSTPFNVLQFQRDLSDAATAEIRALADYNKALAQLSWAEGTILRRNRIEVDVR